MSLWPPVWRGCCRSWQRDSKYIKPISFHWWEKSIWPSVLFTCRLSRRDGGADEVDLLLTWSHWRPAGHSGRLRATRRLTRCKNMTWFKFESYWQQVWWDATTLDLLICTEYTVVFFFFSSSSSPSSSSFLIPHITINVGSTSNTVSCFFYTFLISMRGPEFDSHVRSMLISFPKLNQTVSRVDRRFPSSVVSSVFCPQISPNFDPFVIRSISYEQPQATCTHSCYN